VDVCTAGHGISLHFARLSYKKNSRIRLTPCDRPVPRDASVPAERRYSPPRYAASRPHRLQLPLDPVAGASPSASKFHAPVRWLKRPPSPPRHAVLRPPPHPGQAPEEGVSLAEHRLGTGATGCCQAAPPSSTTGGRNRPFPTLLCVAWKKGEKRILQAYLSSVSDVLEVRCNYFRWMLQK